MRNLHGAYQTLEGLSVGDSLGNVRTFESRARLESRKLPNGPWSYTDDTEMALSIYEALSEVGRINQDRLATAFAVRYNPRRGYGDGARRLLNDIGSSRSGAWRDLSKNLFYGTGSYGNGAAMRVAPLGAFFYQDYELCAKEARLSAEVTHAHPEGIAGAVAVAVAAAWMRREKDWNREGFFSTILEHTPTGQTRDGIEKARELDSDKDSYEAGQLLGNGHQISAQDTVPFCLWSAAVDPDDFEETFWRTILAGGDQDTTCAIACGIVAARTAAPSDWVERREKLPTKAPSQNLAPCPISEIDLELPRFEDKARPADLT